MTDEFETVIQEPETLPENPKSPLSHVMIDYIQTVFFMILYFFKGLFRF